MCAADAVGKGDGVVRIHLARHGRTHLNAAGVLRGRLDPPLDAVGRAEAAALGDALGTSPLQFVVASPLRRAMETAAAIAAHHRSEVEADARFADRDYGQWAGHAEEELVARWGSVDGAPGVEPVAELQARAWEGLADLAERLGPIPGEAAIVSHDAVIRHLLVAADPSIGHPALISLTTGSCNVVEHRSNGWSVHWGGGTAVGGTAVDGSAE